MEGGTAAAMLTLAIETATRYGSLALLEEEVLVADNRLRNDMDLAQRLVPALDRLMAGCGKKVDDLSLIAVGLGPGFFTSIRVGLATAQGLAQAAGKPIVGVSSLQAAAYPLRFLAGSIICPVLGAGRGQVFAAAYQADGEKLTQLFPEQVIDHVRLRDWQLGEGVVYTGGAAELPAAWLGKNPRVVPPPACYPSAQAVGCLGGIKYGQQGPDNLIALRPTYLRPSAAEMEKKARQET